MNNRPECLPCCLRRVLHTAERATADEWLHRRIVADSMNELARVDDKITPAEVIHGLARRASKTLGVADPYASEKHEWITETTANEDWIRSAVEEAPDPFLAALKLSLAANILDCELRHDFAGKVTLKGLVKDSQSLSVSAENVAELRQALGDAKKVLFLHDSAGELYFDRLFIEVAQRARGERGPASFFSVVRELPILADATREDAAAVGLDRFSTVIDLGIDCLGVPLNACSKELLAHYDASDVILAKGQAAYETLEGQEPRQEGLEKRVFFLLRVKCPVVGRRLGASVGECIVELG